MVLSSVAENGSFKMKGQISSSDPRADGELKRREGQIYLRPVFDSILFIASSLDSGVMCTWRLVLTAAIPSELYQGLRISFAASM